MLTALAARHGAKTGTRYQVLLAAYPASEDE